MTPEQQEKYSRQILFAALGREGQECLLAAGAVLVGCGALGTAQAALLARAGVGRLRIIDRDFVEPSNLQRQSLFTEADAVASLPKAVAAQQRLREINSDVQVEAVVADLTPQRAVELLGGFPLLLDGTDNFETRFLLNDAAVELGVPWVYGAVVGSYGLTMTVLPGETACLACLLESGPRDAAGMNGAEDTCDTVGVLGAAVGVVAAWQAAEALKLLAGRRAALHGRLLSCDVWSGQVQSVRVARNANCRACVRKELVHLRGATQPHVTLCGRDSVQIHERQRQLDLGELGRRVAGAARDVRSNDFLLQFRVAGAGKSDGYQVTVFADGRAVFKGTKDPAVARSLYARYIGA
jgi:adenylyltransferase/sulfurtransferase